MDILPENTAIYKFLGLTSPPPSRQAGLSLPFAPKNGLVNPYPFNPYTGLTSPPPPFSVYPKDDRFARTFVGPIDRGTHSDAKAIECLFVPLPSPQLVSGRSSLVRRLLLSAPSIIVVILQISFLCYTILTKLQTMEVNNTLIGRKS
jgi:hypothetical protein